jgi:hypothetical protein
MAGNNKTYLVLDVKCPIFLSDFNQIWIFSIDFCEVFNTKSECAKFVVQLLFVKEPIAENRILKSVSRFEASQNKLLLFFWSRNFDVDKAEEGLQSLKGRMSCVIQF